MKLFNIIPALLFSLTALGQDSVQMSVKGLPPHHDHASAIYLAGSFNGWNPRDSNFRFIQDDKGNYFLWLRLNKGSYEYKLTNGGWDKAETDENGFAVSNRKLEIPSTAVSVSVKGWAHQFAAKPRKSTASANVYLMDSAFLVPQLNRNRRIWIYLPNDYHSESKKKYQVLYMHDGQNLFDDTSSFSGEWGIDEFMDTTKLAASIVVAIDHGAARRVTEYSPCDTEKYGKAEGDAYLNFLVNTLKPYIDLHYRTLKDKQHTAIAGSSMGGLISIYAVLKYPNVFGKAGVFSPSFWLCGDQLFHTMQELGKQVNSNIYFYAGKQEGKQMVEDVLRAAKIMSKVSKSKLTTVIREDGKHNEATWRREFPLYYQWNQVNLQN